MDSVIHLANAFNSILFRKHTAAKYILGSNWSVDNEILGHDWQGYGFSTIYGPEAKIIAQAKSLFGSEIVYADLPRDK